MYIYTTNSNCKKLVRISIFKSVYKSIYIYILNVQCWIAMKYQKALKNIPYCRLKFNISLNSCIPITSSYYQILSNLMRPLTDSKDEYVIIKIDELLKIDISMNSLHIPPHISLKYVEGLWEQVIIQTKYQMLRLNPDKRWQMTSWNLTNI